MQLVGLEKQSRQRHIRGWVQCAVTPTKSLNVVDHITEYLKRTENLVSETQTRFISLSKPYKPISTAKTFATWTLMLMTEAGIDTGVFKTHSTRSAVPANLRAKCLSLDQIMRRTDWTSQYTFNTFYSRQAEGETDGANEANEAMLRETATEETRDNSLLNADPLIQYEVLDEDWFNKDIEWVHDGEVNTRVEETDFTEAPSQVNTRVEETDYSDVPSPAAFLEIE